VKKAVRMIIGAIYAAAFAIVVGSWGICYAYIERGYIAFGGAYLLLVGGGKWLPFYRWVADGEVDRV